jgi:hypothetical protein
MSSQKQPEECLSNLFDSRIPCKPAHSREVSIRPLAVKTSFPYHRSSMAQHKFPTPKRTDLGYVKCH